MTEDEAGCPCFGPRADGQREGPLSSIRPLSLPPPDRTAGWRLTRRDGQAGTEGRFTRGVVRLDTVVAVMPGVLPGSPRKEEARPAVSTTGGRA